MGTDIHQLNVFLDDDYSIVRCESEHDGGFITVDEQKIRSEMFDLIPELVDYRSYDVFGVLAGVRGSFMKIKGSSHDPFDASLESNDDKAIHLMRSICCRSRNSALGYEESYDDDLMLCDSCIHSHTWYHPHELIRSLQFTTQKIDAVVGTDIYEKFPIIMEYESDMFIDDIICLKQMLTQIYEKLIDAKDRIAKDANGVSFDKSVVMFYFDS
jgi:hypothetical protein